MRRYFSEILDVDVFDVSTEALRKKVESEGISIDASLSRLDCLDLLMTHRIEPAIAGWGLVFVTDFLPEQSALAPNHHPWRENSCRPIRGLLRRY